MKKHQTLKTARKARKAKVTVKRDVSEDSSNDQSTQNGMPPRNGDEGIMAATLTSKKRDKLLADKLDEENE